MNSRYIYTIPSETSHNVYFNNVLLGTFEPAEDGYFYFCINQDRTGYWDAFVLREIADKLDEMNKEWEETVKKDCTA